MAVGDLVVAPLMYEINGIVFGHSTDFIVSKVEGLFGTPDTKNTDYNRMDAWGEYPGRKMYKGRTITFTLKIIGFPDPAARGDIDANYAKLMAALTLADTGGQMNPFQLVFQRPGWTAKRFVYAYPDKDGITSDSDWSTGLITAAVQLVCNDPRHYALQSVTDTLVLTAGTSSISESCQNNGNTPGTPIININFTVTSTQFASMVTEGTTFLSLTNATDGNKSILIPWETIMGGPSPAAVAAARQQLSIAQSALTSAQTTLTADQKTLSSDQLKLAGMKSTDPNYSTQQELITADKAVITTDQNNVTAAQNEINQAQAALNTLNTAVEAALGEYTVSVDFRQRTITSNGNDISGSMDPSSKFWKLQAGANTLVFNFGQNFAPGATISITHTDTWSG